MDIEGDIVWTTEYLRYRVAGCTHAAAQQLVVNQIGGAAAQSGCPPTNLTIFKNDFNSERLGALSLQANTGPLPLSRPTRGQGFDVAGPALGFTTQSLRVGCCFGDAIFDNPSQYVSGQFLIQWRSSISAVPARTNAGSVGIVVLGSIVADFLSVFYGPSRTYQVEDANYRSGRKSIGAYTPGIPDLFELVINLDNGTYVLTINRSVTTSGPIAADPGQRLFRLNFSGVSFSKFWNANNPSNQTFLVDDLVISRLQ